MKCANCQMLNNTPETPCTHCGRMMPALKPSFISKPDAEDENAEGESSGVSTEEGQEEAQETGQDEGQAEEEVDLESGHVDNVGDDSETPVP